MKKTAFAILLTYSCSLCYSQQLNLTGGVNLTKGNIDADILKQVIQEKQEEVFTRLFTNIIVKYFRKTDPSNGVYNFATYYSLYNLMADLTVGKSKTTVSKAVINSISELAFMYSFVKFYQDKQIEKLHGTTRSNADSNKISNVQLIDSVNENGTVSRNEEKLKTLNYYMEGAYEVLAKSKIIQDKFYFKRPITSSEIKSWYENDGMIYISERRLKDILGQQTTFKKLVEGMRLEDTAFLNYSSSGKDSILRTIAGLRKNGNGFQTLTAQQVNAVKLILIEFANKTDYLFDQNVAKTLINLTAENIHFGLNDSQEINQVYLDVESLVLSLDEEFIQKSKKSSISSKYWFINPRPFFTIGSANGFFLNNNNQLDKTDAIPTALKNINLASEKIGFKVKVYDGGYTHSFGPGQLFQWKGQKRAWLRPKTKPLISSVFYNIYASGLLYNVLNLKTNKNFDFGYVASNIGVSLFNGLEFSAGVGVVYKDELNAKNSFIKIDFDIPILDYLTALKKKRSN